MDPPDASSLHHPTAGLVPGGSFDAEPPFVGRAGELAHLEALWASVVDGAPALVVIEGEAGAGKSALSRTFVTRADKPWFRVDGDENERNTPYAALQQIFPDVMSPGRDPVAVGADLLVWLGTVQEHGAFVLVVDDLQWWDSPSVHALTFALRRLRKDPVMAVLNCREGELPAPARRVIDTGRASHLRLGGLTVDDVGDLAHRLGRTTVSPRALYALWAHTSGSPLHLRALLHELDDQVLAATTPGPLPAPHDFAQLVHAKLAGCSAETRALVAAASVLGQRLRLSDAAALVDIADPMVALEEAVTADLLAAVAGAVPLEVAFTHPLVRSAIYYDMNPARRSRLHGTAAGRTDGVAAIEHRVAGALAEDPELAGDLVAVATVESASGSFAAAAAHLLAAAQLTAEASARRRFRLDAAQLLLAAGDLEEAAAAFSASGGEATARGRCVAGHLALLTGRQDDAERSLLAAWEGVGAEEPERDVAAQAATALGHLYLFWQRYADAAAWAARALTIDRTSPLTSTAHGVQLVGLLPSEGESAVAQASAWLPDAVEEPSATEAEGLLGRGIARLWAGSLVEARRDLAVAADGRRLWRPLRTRILALGYLAETEFRLGEWDDAIAHGGLAASLADDGDQTWLAAFAHAQATAPLAARGQEDNARDHADAARDYARLLGDDANAAFAAMARAQVGFSLGDAGEVVEALWPLRAAQMRQGIDEPGVFPWRELLAGALIDLGRDSDASDVLESFDTLASERKRAWPLAAAARVRARQHSAHGDQMAAEAAFEEAAHHLTAVPMPFEQALLHDDRGRALRRFGRRRDAAACLREALDIHEQLGAAPFAERCRRELAACGIRQRAASARPDAELTPQETAVVQLLLTGRRNREIATELFVSIKTVEYHLGNIYRKLGVSSRAELIASHATGRRGAAPGFS